MKKKVDDECDLSCETERIKGYIVDCRTSYSS